MRNTIKDKVLQFLDIVEVIGESVSLTRRGKDYLGLCPFHPDRKPSLSVSPKKQIFKCFACGAGGDVFKFVQMREKIDFREALTRLARRAGIDTHVTEADRRADQIRDQLRKALEWACSHYRRNLEETPGGAAALEYALGRGLTRETIDQFGMGYAANEWDDLLRIATRAGVDNSVLHQAGLITTNENGRTYDRFRHRLIFPIRDALGRPVAFGGRALGDDPAKYLNSPETSLFSKSRILYGLDLTRQAIEHEREAIVVEGYTDVVLLHQFGFTRAIATLGTALTDAHIKLLRPLADRLILCFDGDQAGARAADRAVEVSLLGGLDVRVVVLEAGLDPADCVLKSGATGFEAALASAVDALQFKWTQTVTAFDQERPGSRRAAIESLLEFIASLTASGGIDPLEKGFLVRRLSELLALPTESIHEMLAAARRRSRRAQPSDTDGLDEVSTYLGSIRGLPVGLVAAVEDCFGMLMSDAGCTEWIDDKFVQAVGVCQVWSNLSAAIQDILEEQGGYERADVIARCDDAAVCELISRSCARVAGATVTKEAFLGARNRLGFELDIEQMGQLQRNLGRSDTDALDEDEVFGDLLDISREQRSALQAEKRWIAKSAS